MYALTYFTLSFGFTLWFSHFLLRYVDPSFFIDKPNLSKLHKKPRSRYGGIAFGIVTIVLAALSINNSGEYNWYLLGAIFIILLGAVDDHISISWWVKLFVQIFIGLMILFHFLPQVNHFTFLGTIQIFEKTLVSDLKNIKSLNQTYFKVFSQDVEDGIIQYLLKSLDIKNVKFVEIGTQDYSESNTRYIFETMRCNGLIIDPTPNLEKKN